MAIQAELVARLTAAIDNPNTHVDGNAAAPDEGQAAVLLERLVRSYNASLATSSASPSSNYNARLARWADNIDDSFAAFDRSLRALMMMIRERAARDEFDEIIDPNIAAMDPDTETNPLDLEVNAVGYIHSLLKYLPDIDPSVHNAALQCARAYESFSRRPEPARDRPRVVARSPYALDYPAAKAAAEAYCEYLDAIALPGGVP
jgi:hypothetical protein